VRVLMMRCDTRFTTLNLRIRTLIGEAGRELRTATRRSRMKRLIKHTDIHLRIRTLIGEAGRELRTATRRSRMKRLADSTAKFLF
jgi:hypothetical protein